MTEIQIGEGNYGYSSIRHHVYDFISQNNISYWCYDHEDLFENKMIIMKNTKEGQKLTKLMAENYDVELINDYLLAFRLDHLTLSQFKDIIDNVKKQSFIEGIENNQRQMRMALGMKEL